MMSRADRLSNLIVVWAERERQLAAIALFFREHHNAGCAEIAEFGLEVLRRCLADFRRENYPLDQPVAPSPAQETTEP